MEERQDLISRQVAIDDFYKHPNVTWTTLDVLEHINALPSVQPEPTLEQIKEYCHKRCLSIVDNALLYKYAQSEIQPEIIYCKDCVCGHCEVWLCGDGSMNVYGYCGRTNFRVLPYDFCSRAERKTDE